MLGRGIRIHVEEGERMYIICGDMDDFFSI